MKEHPLVILYRRVPVSERASLMATARKLAYRPYLSDEQVERAAYYELAKLLRDRKPIEQGVLQRD